MTIPCAVLLVAVFAGSIRAQEVEPYGEMNKTIAVIFDRNKNDVIIKLIATLAQVKGVEVDAKTGKALVKMKVRHVNFSHGTWMRENAEQLDIQDFSLWWTPPQAPPQKISGGGKHIRSLRSSIDIEIASLKGRQSPTVVFFRRSWEYRGMAHVPYTEIPLLPLRSSDSGSYSSDKTWVRNLAPRTVRTELANKIIYSPEVLSALKR